MGESIIDKPFLVEREDDSAEPITEPAKGGSIIDKPFSVEPAPAKPAPKRAGYLAESLRGMIDPKIFPSPYRELAYAGQAGARIKPVRQLAEAELTGLGYLGTAADVALTRPLKTASRIAGEAAVAPFLGSHKPDVSGIAPARREEARKFAETVPQGPPPKVSLSEAWAQSAQPQWETLAEVRQGKINADPTVGDYIVGIPTEIMTDIGLILGLGAVTLPEKAGAVGLRIKPVMLQQLAGMIERRATIKGAGKWARLKKWLGTDKIASAIKEAGVTKRLAAVGAERKLAVPGKIGERVGRGATALRAATKAEPAVKPTAGLARQAFVAGAEPAGAKVGELAVEGAETSARYLQKPGIIGKARVKGFLPTSVPPIAVPTPTKTLRKGLDLTDAQRALASQTAEYMERAVAGDDEAIKAIARISGGDKNIARAGKALYEGERGVTAARFAGDVPFPEMTAATQRKLDRALALQKRRLGRVTKRGAAIRGRKTVGLMTAEEAAEAGARKGRELRVEDIGKLEAKKAKAEARLATRVKQRGQRIWDAEAGKYVEAVGEFPPKPKVAAKPLKAFEEAVDPAIAAERAAKAIEGGKPLGVIKADLFRAFGKEGYAQALHEAKTVGKLRAQIRVLQRRTTDRKLKKTLSGISEAFDRKFGKLDVKLAASEHKRLVRTIESKRYQRTQKLIPELIEAKRKAPAHITRNWSPEGSKWMTEASMRTRPEAISRPIHALSPSTMERTFADPRTGRSLHLDEIDTLLERTLIDTKFAAQHPDWAQVAAKADKKRGSLAVATVRGKKRMPLVSYVFESDPTKILDTSVSRAVVDAEQSGFIRELKTIGSAEKQRGWTHVKKLVSKDRPNPAMEELVKQLGDTYFPPEVMGELKRTVTNLTDASTQNKFVKMYDNVLGKWKWSVTAPFPGFHMRNVTSNMVMIVGNGVRAESAIIADSTKYITRKGFIKVGGNSIPGDKFARQMRAWKISGGLGREVAGKTLGATDEAFRGGYAADRLREAVEQWGDKLTPKHWQYARDQVNKTLGNYRDVGGTGKFLQRTILPFWKWTRHSVPQHVEWLFTKPYILNAEAKIGKLTGGAVQRRAGTILGTGNPLEDTADFVDMAKDIVSGKKAEAWRKGSWQFSPPIVEVGKAITGWATGGKPVKAPRGAEYMPESWRKVFGIREVDGQVVMPSHSKAISKLIRLFNEVRKHYKADNTTEAWIRSLTGIGKSDASQAEDDLNRMYDRLNKVMKSLRKRGLTKAGYRGAEVVSKAARREPEYRDYKRIMRDMKRVRAVIKRERTTKRRLKADDIKR